MFINGTTDLQDKTVEPLYDPPQKYDEDGLYQKEPDSVLSWYNTVFPW
jgi:hypothetical protein